MKQKYISNDDALLKLQRFCVYQDRCQYEVEKKLKELGKWGEDIDEIMYDLITENFVNEERYACSYARGKFRIKRWGRRRIIQGLKANKISEYCIKKGLQEIDEEEYTKTLFQVFEKWRDHYKEDKIYIHRQKVGAALLRKGFESHLVWALINKEMT